MEFNQSSWGSYPSIFNLGHPAVSPLLESSPLIVEEKMDGSQFSFGSFDGELRCRSKGAIIQPEDPPSLFRKAVETVISLHEKGMLLNGCTYRAEAICSPKHNVLQYNRIPTGGLILFDVSPAAHSYLSPESKRIEADRLGLEVVPTFTVTDRLTLQDIEDFLKKESCLGGPLVEGVVIKPYNYDIFGKDKKVLLGKYVSEAFKEVHRNEWNTLHGPEKTGHSLIQMIGADLRTYPRWEKAIQRLREADVLTHSPKDIGPLMKEVSQDLDKEMYDVIAEALMKRFWKDIKRYAVRGLPEWYKERLLAEAFAPKTTEDPNDPHDENIRFGH